MIGRMSRNIPQSAIGADRATASGLQKLVELLARQAAQNWQADLHAPESGAVISLLRENQCADEHGSPT